MPSNHLILCHPLLLLPSIFPSIRVSSNESVLRIRWPKYWSFSFSISPSHEYSGLTSFRIDWFDLLQSKGLSSIFSSTTVQKHQFFSAQLFFYGPIIYYVFRTVVLENTLESLLDCKEIQPVHSEGDQPWVFFGGNDAKAETPVLWPPHVKS